MLLVLILISNEDVVISDDIDLFIVKEAEETRLRFMIKRCDTGVFS
jgi:hypothetical protein